MNSINPKSFKTLLVLFGTSILLILIFLILKVFFQKDKTLELKNFNSHKVVEKQTPKKEVEEVKKDKFLLLPSK